MLVKSVKWGEENGGQGGGVEQVEVAVDLLEGQESRTCVWSGSHIGLSSAGLCSR